ncbi:hypothetical protein GGS20DRAFT_149087 [Poronia punctata]|nr:hypothetical protein GGS20DRAFT_149087 [Poronia punctata]
MVDAAACFLDFLDWVLSFLVPGPAHCSDSPILRRLFCRDNCISRALAGLCPHTEAVYELLYRYYAELTRPARTILVYYEVAPVVNNRTEQYRYLLVSHSEGTPCAYVRMGLSNVTPPLSHPVPPPLLYSTPPQHRSAKNRRRRR